MSQVSIFDACKCAFTPAHAVACPASFYFVELSCCGTIGGCTPCDTLLTVNLNIDGTKSDQNVRGQVNYLHDLSPTLPPAFRLHYTQCVCGAKFTRCHQAVLPHSLGSNLRVLVFARGAAADAARAGAKPSPAPQTPLTVQMQRERTTWAQKTWWPRYRWGRSFALHYTCCC
jgi:hypothetical protein